MDSRADIDSIIRKALEEIHKETGLAVSRIGAKWEFVGTYGGPCQHALTYIEIDRAYVDTTRKSSKNTK